MKLTLTTISLAAACASALAITPNKLLTRGLTAKTSAGDNTYITDGTLTNWKQCTAKDIALNVGEGPKKLFISWESYGDCAWATNFTNNCGHNGTPLKTFKIMTSGNSTDGQDGDWTVAAEIEDNPVMSRGVDIDFDDMSWFRIVSDEEVGQILEIEAHDMTDGGDDTWFFMGTSISQMGLKQQETDTTTADLIHARFPDYDPVMLRGGIGCINSTEVVSHLSDYLKYAGNVHYWAIEMGTNDCWGGGDWNLDTYKNNMQTIIDSAKAHGIEPIIARIIATNESVATWQVNSKYLDAIDDLVESNNLNQGPDFYTYFLAHPELISTSDGVHPNGETGGGQAMHHLWAEALAPLYAKQVTPVEEDTAKTATPLVNASFALPQIAVDGRNLQISNLGSQMAGVELISLLGRVEAAYKVVGPLAVITADVPTGVYMVRVKTATSTTTAKVVIK